MIKLENEKSPIKEKIILFGIDKIKDYSIKLKVSKEYTNFNTRLCFDVLHAIDFNCVYTNYLYSTYDCNDNHIETLIKQVLKELTIID